jgi:HD-GYP domain-containing protein (c-di-GMP phosphodiesterase class II)/DNA-binding CsgD family transcriptional regulator
MPDTLRLAELMAALSLATDLGMGQPLEQALRTCLVALGLAERLGVRGEELSEVYYVALLRFIGCTADAHELARMAGGDELALRAAVAPVMGGSPREAPRQVMPVIGAGQSPLRRARLIARMMRTIQHSAREGVRADCELAEALAVRLSLPAGVQRALAVAFEQWNGRGLPNGVGGEDLPLSARIVYVARDVEVLHRVGGRGPCVTAVRRRSGEAYDPAVAAAFLDRADEMLSRAQVESPWQEVLDQEPQPRPWVPAARFEAVLTAFADFVDLKCPWTAGHSREVARLAAAAVPPADAPALRHAGLLHDMGRVGVANGIWDKPGPLTEGEWECVRLHSYYTERIASRVDALRHLAAVACTDHERLDGSGYHRGARGSDISSAARVLAAADAYQAMTQPRPHRPALSGEQAAAELEAMARDGGLDTGAVAAVLTAAGHDVRPPRREWPSGLTEREVEVLRLICRGGTKKQVAALLGISAHTVDHHVRHVYDKAGVHTRAGATLFALEHDLLG